MAFLGTDIDLAYMNPSSFHPSNFEEAAKAPHAATQVQAPNVAPPPPPQMQPSHQMQPILDNAPPPKHLQYDPNIPQLPPMQRNEQDLMFLQREMARQKEPKFVSSGPSLLDNMWSKRRDILKLVIVSLLILLAISCHTMIDHVLKKYIMDNDLSDKNELLVRCAYPFMVLLLIWMIKVFNR